MDEYGKRKKKFVFYEDDHVHAKLIVKFMEDGIKQASFFKEFVKAYIEDDPNIRKWIDNNDTCKVSGRSLAKRKRQQRLLEKQKNEFNLDQNVVDEIFDILADELGDE